MTSSSLTNRSPQNPLAPAAESFGLGPAMPSTYGGGPPLSPVARFLGALRRFKWLVLAVFLVGTVVSVLATRLMPKRYQVGVTLNLFNRSDDGTTPIQAPQLLSSRQWIELLNTDRVLRPVVIERKLYIRGPFGGRGIIPPPLEGPAGPEAQVFESFEIGENTIPGRYKLEVASDARNWTLTNVRTGRVERGGAELNIGSVFGFTWTPKIASLGGRTIEFEVLTPTEVAASLAHDLTVQMAPMGARFMHISLEGRDPVGIARTLNTVADRFVETAATIKRSNLSEESRILDSQLVQARGRMDAAQAALQTFRIQAITLPSEGVPIGAGSQQTQAPVIADYMVQRKIVDSLVREQAELRNALASAQSGALAVDRFLNIGAVGRASELQSVLKDLATAETGRRQLLVQFYPTHDTIQKLDRRIAEIRNVTLPQYVDAVLQRLHREQVTMESRIQTGTRELQQIPQRTIREEELKRELAIAETQYKEITSRAELSKMQVAVSLPDVDILDRAVAPVEPLKSRSKLILIIGTLGSLVAALGLAFLLDMTDRRFRYSDQVTSDLGLSILGAVPEIRGAKGGTAAAEEASQVIEAFRSIRLNMMHVVGGEGPICFTVSSPMPGDGKSLVSSNLALSFAEAGFNVLLVDGDTRRGELHRMFGLDRRPGLLDHLADGIPLEQTFRPTSHPRLTVITGGARHRNGPELLGSNRMRSAMAQLRERFDVVIFDSPPFGAGIDPFLLGTLTGNLLMVVRVGETEREFTEAKLQVLDQLPVRVVGAILNDVRTSMREYRYYSYSYGYGSTDEGDGRPGNEAAPTLPATAGAQDEG